MNVIRIDRRSDQIHVSRASLSHAAENALAANRNAQDAVDRIAQHIWSGDRAAAIHTLGRIGFEIGERNVALMELTQIAETATRCSDGMAAPAHGSAA